MKIYLAGPLFSEAERAWLSSTRARIDSLARERCKDVTVIWPYELITKSEIDDLGPRAMEEIFRRCREALKEADLVVALLDGPQVDDGTAWELGYFYALHPGEAKIIGVRTDFRKAGEAEASVVNAMIEGSCSRIVHTSEHLLDAVFDSIP
ncbi:MAG: nucleoside 2-deoxyribosyltransferase [Syntrophobacteraceae bacterium]